MQLTENGKIKINIFIAELKAKRKEVLDAGKDTADETNLPDENDILSDIEWSENENGYYCSCWGCTDNTDLTISLTAGEDFICEEENL